MRTNFKASRPFILILLVFIYFTGCGNKVAPIAKSSSIEDLVKKYPSISVKRDKSGQIYSFDAKSAPLQNEDLKAFQSVDSVESLYLQGTRIGSGGLKYLRGLKNLFSLHLPAHEWTQKDFSILPTFKRLRSFSIIPSVVPPAGTYWTFFNVPPKILAPTAGAFDELGKVKSLRFLVLANVKVGKNITWLSNLTNLIALDLSNTGISDLVSFKNMKLLKTLALSRNPLLINEANIEKLVTPTFGLRLALRNVSFTEGSGRLLFSNKSLMALDVSGSNGVNDEFFAAIGTNSTLDGLRARDTHISDKVFSHIAGLKNLGVLDIGKNSLITGKGIAQLKTLKELFWLDLSGCPRLNNEGVKEIGELKTLHRLYLNSRRRVHRTPGLTGEIFSAFGSLKKLTILYVDGLQQINSALEHLESLNQLKKLSLRNSEVDSDVLHSLESLEQLESIYLEGHNYADGALTNEDFEKLKAAHEKLDKSFTLRY